MGLRSYKGLSNTRLKVTIKLNLFMTDNKHAIVI